MFSHCLHPSAQALPPCGPSSHLRLGVTGHDQLTVDAQNDVDVALKNLVGDGAADAAQRWADHGKLLKKISVVRGYLGEEERDIVDKLLGTDRSTRRVSGEPLFDPPERTFGDKGKGKETITARYYVRESEEDTDFGDSDDERGRTAHTLFASLAGIDTEDKENVWWFSSPPSEQDVDISQDLLNAGNKGRGEPVGDGSWRLNRLTPAVSSPIRAPPSKLGSKSCNVTPRQSQLGVSVRKKAAAHNKASPAIPGTPNPSRFITRGTGGHSLPSPICLLYSSPVVPAKGRRQIPEQMKPSADPSHARPALPKPPATTSNARNIKNARNILIRETALKICDHQSENSASSSAPPPTSFVLNARPNTSAKRKHLTDEWLSLAPGGSKKRRVTSSINVQPGIALHQINDAVVSTWAISSKEVINSNPEIQIPSGEGFIRTEHEKLALERLDISQQLANAYPHLVAPSYKEKRAKQLAKLTKKERGREAANVINRCETVKTTNQRLVQSQTIFSFETVDDDDGGMDWNRSRQLADDLREAIANGRRPVLPSLKCAQTPSPSP